MNYIVFDLEWNQSSSPYSENEMIPFEIIEIGAVKLNDHFKEVDQFSSIVRPCVYRKLQKRIKEMLNYDEEYLKTGQPFYKVCREFLEWCGEEGTYMFCSWGPLDLHYLQQNMDFYGLPKLTTPLKYYDLQSIYQEMKKEDLVSKLEKAVVEMRIPIEEPFHSAIHDARYTAKVMAAMKIRHLEDKYQIDVYNNPKTKEEEIISYHRKYMEHITREYDSKMDVLEDKELRALHCNKCNRKISKKIKWFASNPTVYMCAGRCWYHGNLIGKMKFRSTFDENVFVIKTVEQVSKSEVEQLKNRQDLLRERRKEKRHMAKKKEL